ncbi:MAG: hypothetical protein CMA41_04515 [Euryarchaeota archaeon]|jgi:hypothetical protein|nr:hypothetical protein [Euryarchaeota archaeon]|tara:strand:- start:1224 stop:2210 length:987 start_codon:yes stop_codon:yes gene_type:complete
MDGLRYAVGGSPISHSLSPILFNLVLADLRNKGQFSKLDVSSITTLKTDHIDEVLGWAYIEHDKHQPIWKPVDQKLRVFQSQLYDYASHTIDEKPFSGMLAKLKTPLRALSNKQLPVRSSSNEVWLNLTSPLKHQIQSMVFSPIDEALDIISVNTLRYTGQGWYCATTDGFGVVNVAYHFGIDVSKGALLGINGGGGAARSIASAWMNCGGKVASLGGRRQLPATLVNTKHGEDLVFDLVLDTEGSLQHEPNSKYSLNPAYAPLEGSLQERLEHLSIESSGIDGRWMLAAQHLESWRSLWTPDHAQHLPTLEQLMTWLLSVEYKLEEN